MSGWTLYQFNDIVDSFLDGCSSEMKDNLEVRLDLLSEKGNTCTMPASEPLKDGLFALRCKDANKQARLIYYFTPNREIIFVHAFYKDRREIRLHNIETAKRNRKIIQDRKEKIYGLNITH
jgi:hypothetical protein